MSTSGPQERFHSLDALRGWAMLLGIVLHAAWIMASRYSGTPITDADGSYLYDYISYIIHIFRLQTFYVMAGFFAHLVLSRRGQWSFIWHRVSRIGIPLVVGWLILYPIMTVQFVAGGLQSGRVLSNDGFWTTALNETLAALKADPALTHLWFLYDLMALYALAILLRALFGHLLDRKKLIRKWTADRFTTLTQSRWLIPTLAIASAVFLFFEPWWWGVDGYPQWLVPPWPGFLGYFIFFSFGWLLYDQWQLLTVISRNWQTKLAAGVALSIPLFLITTYVDLNVSFLYPMLTDQQIKDLSEFDQMARTNPRSGPKERIWESLSPLYQEMLSNHGDLSSDQKAGLALELNKSVIGNPGFYEPSFWRDEQLPENVEMMLADHQSTGSEPEVTRLNRQLLELAMPGTFTTNNLERASMQFLKVGFSIGYGLAMWCLVFGVIGAFYNLFPNASPTSRYIADSSYWVYLLHLPVMFQIELWIAGSHWGFWGIPKFIVYNVGTAAVCFLTYHYCVRSTLIGRVLNGRKYPFVPLFGKRPVVESVPDSPAIPAPNFRLTGKQDDAAVAPHFHADGSPSVSMEIDLEEA